MYTEVSWEVSIGIYRGRDGANGWYHQPHRCPEMYGSKIQQKSYISTQKKYVLREDGMHQCPCSCPGKWHNYRKVVTVCINGSKKCCRRQIPTPILEFREVLILQKVCISTHTCSGLVIYPEWHHACHLPKPYQYGEMCEKKAYISYCLTQNTINNDIFSMEVNADLYQHQYPISVPP